MVVINSDAFCSFRFINLKMAVIISSYNVFCHFDFRLSEVEKYCINLVITDIYNLKMAVIKTSLQYRCTQ